MNNHEHETILGLMGDFRPEPEPEPEPALPLDELTQELRLLRRGLEEHNRIAKVQNEALKVLADQGVTAWHQMAAVMQMIWSEHTKEQRRQ